MSEINRPFEIERSFGLGVLLKLTKKSVSGVEIHSDGDKFTSNVSLNELSSAVDSTLKAHNIKLKIK